MTKHRRKAFKLREKQQHDSQSMRRRLRKLAALAIGRSEVVSAGFTFAIWRAVVATKARADITDLAFGPPGPFLAAVSSPGLVVLSALRGWAAVVATERARSSL